MIVKFLMKRQIQGNSSSDSIRNEATDGIAIETSLETVKAFFGDDTFVIAFDFIVQ